MLLIKEGAREECTECTECTGGEKDIGKKDSASEEKRYSSVKNERILQIK